MTKDMKSDQPVEQVSARVTLVALERGFTKGQMVHPGTKFTFDRTPHPDTPKHKLADDGLLKLPKWAAPEGTPMPKKPVAGDLKPKAAQDAVKSKAAALSGNSPST
jgi:hypothetical protein